MTDPIPATTQPARTRYAPSPTGRTHLGNMRTALFAWLWARHTGGQFLLRIEDTDRERYIEGARDELMDALRWLGLAWDEGPDIGGPYGPYVQSERLGRYHETAEQLIAAGRAYYCDCSKERLEIVRKSQLTRGVKNPRYDGHCRARGLGPGPDRVIRFRMPDGGTTIVNDAQRGAISFDNSEIGDPIIVKTDGYPTYHLAAMVDDHDELITHVIRADEWLPSAPIHVQLYHAFGWGPPVFVHLALVTDYEHKKIKKRTGDADSAAHDPSDEYQEYAAMVRVATLRDKGYLPMGVLNFLAFLGWHPGTTEEIMTPQEIIARFSLERISTSPAVFDVDRLNWFNQQHMKRLSAEELTTLALPYLAKAYGAQPSPLAAQFLDDPAKLAALVMAVRDELTALSDVVAATRFVFVSPYDDEPSPEIAEVLRAPNAADVLAALRARLPEAGDLAAADGILKALREGFKASHKLGGKQVMQPIRVALTGALGGPHLTDIIILLGAQESARRIDQALAIAQTAA